MHPINLTLDEFYENKNIECKQGVATMRIKDRTTEFFSIVSVRSGQQPQYDVRSPRSALRHHTRFTLAALEVNNGVQSLLSKLEKLTKRTI